MADYLLNSMVWSVTGLLTGLLLGRLLCSAQTKWRHHR